MSWRIFLSEEEHSLPRSSKIFHTLANVTVVAVLDKEGIVARPAPLPEQIAFLVDDMISLQIGPHEHSSFQFEIAEENWSKYMSSLKPIGLNCILNTDVEAKKEKNSFYQLKRLRLNSFGKVEMAKQMNIDYVGRSIGFKDEALKTYRVHRHIYSWAPNGETIGRRRREVEVPTMASIIMEETVSGRYQLLSEGHVELILANCSDYWNGKEVQPLDDEARQKIMEQFTRWNDKDLQHVAYAFRPLNITENSPYLLDTEDVSLQLSINPEHVKSSFFYTLLNKIPENPKNPKKKNPNSPNVPLPLTIRPRH